MVEESARVVTPCWGLPTHFGARKQLSLPDMMTPREIVTVLAGMLSDSSTVFKVVLSLCERIARDPTLLRVLHALAMTAGIFTTSENFSPRAGRPAMPASCPVNRRYIPPVAQEETTGDFTSKSQVPSGTNHRSRARAPPSPVQVTTPRPPYTFTQVEGDEMRIYDAGLKPIARKSLPHSRPTPASDPLPPSQPTPGCELLNASGTNLASLPANSSGRPFVLLAFDINHLHARACQAFPDVPVRVVKQIQRAVLSGIPAGQEYFAYYFASQHLVRFRRDQLADTRHAWYIEQGIKGWGEDGKPRYADIDVPLAHVLTQILERYPGQVSRVVLGSGDKDHKMLGETIKATGIPLDIIAVDEADVSRELRRQADRILPLFP